MEDKTNKQAVIEIDVQPHYVNGLEIGLSPTDVLLKFKFNNRLATSIVCSHSYLKSLTAYINNTCEELEKTIGHPIESADTILTAFQNTKK